MNRAVVGSDCQRGQAPSFLTTMFRGGTGNKGENEDRKYGNMEERREDRGKKIWKSEGNIKKDYMEEWREDRGIMGIWKCWRDVI